MATNDEIQTEENNAEEKAKNTSIDIGDLYKFKREDLILDISSTHYSNLTYMQVASRETILDFLELPGVKKDGKMVINGVRIYLSHVAAQMLVEKLGRLLETAYEDGKITQLEFTKPKDVELSTEINRQTEEEAS
jgi:hypothetical protein